MDIINFKEVLKRDAKQTVEVLKTMLVVFVISTGLSLWKAKPDSIWFCMNIFGFIMTIVVALIESDNLMDYFISPK